MNTLKLAICMNMWWSDMSLSYHLQIPLAENIVVYKERFNMIYVIFLLRKFSINPTWSGSRPKLLKLLNMCLKYI